MTPPLVAAQPALPKLPALASILLLVLLVACSSSQDSAGRAQQPAAQAGRAGAARQLAYEHSVEIDAAPGRIAAIRDAGTAACRTAGATACTLLDARIDSEPRIGAALKFRARPEVIPQLVAAMADRGEIARQSTRAEDLSGPIADTARRLAMLEDYRARLEALRSRAGNDIDALIKLNRELADVQSNLETADGKRALLAQRVDTEILDVSIRSDRQRPFWMPIRRALAEFGGDLAQGIAFAVSSVAYLLPWLLMLACAAWGARRLWRRYRGRRPGAG